MIVKCIDVSDDYGTAKGLLTLNKEYIVYKSYGGYYEIDCDDGKRYSKMKVRFKQTRG
jgi:hypothetical protein